MPDRAIGHRAPSRPVVLRDRAIRGALLGGRDNLLLAYPAYQLFLFLFLYSVHKVL